MKKGEVYQGIVEKMNFPNKGIVRIEDTPVTVKNALPGQTVSFRITKKRNGQAEGRLLEVVEPAACEKQCVGDGICLHAGECGGCLYQGFPYEEQLKIKEEQVLRLLKPYLEPLKRVEDSGTEMQNEGTQDNV
ncbi:MAG: TRAM domain-containing protein, partial [Lachnospiraceae bacterium]